MLQSLENQNLLYSVEDGVATITINRPEKLNPLNLQLINDMYELLCSVDADPDVRVVLLRGSGDKAFVAGADIEEFYQMENSFAFLHYLQDNVRLVNRIMCLSQPVIAAVNGYAFGGGCALAMASDLVIATKRSKFAVQEINVGFPGNGSSLTFLVGRQKAAEMTMLGGTYTAEEAKAMMLVNWVVEPEEFEPQISKICGQLKRKSPYALKMAKQVIFNALNTGFSAAGDYEINVASCCFETKPCRAALEAFVKK